MERALPKGTLDETVVRQMKVSLTVLEKTWSDRYKAKGFTSVSEG